MKRYLLFSGEQYYPSGGWGDFVGAFDSLEEARERGVKEEGPRGIGWSQIVDTQTMERFPMRKRFRYDPDLESIVEIGGNYYEDAPRGPNVISDDLKAGVNGIKHMPSGRMLDSKSAHYRENRARGLEHVGNETNFAVKRPVVRPETYIREVQDAKAQLASNWNGTADLRRRERESRKD